MIYIYSLIYLFTNVFIKTNIYKVPILYQALYKALQIQKNRYKSLCLRANNLVMKTDTCTDYEYLVKMQWH